MQTVSTSVQDSITVRVEERAQPWKAYWAPKINTGDEKAYGFPKGEIIAIYGN